jgi:large subunit ribosomal protein L13e
MKHNNVIPNGHFHKDWQQYVRTWFDQPAKKKARRQARIAKAAKIHPRPLNNLRPVVRCQTLKFNRKIRAGRGFTLDELEAAGIPRKLAPTIGVTVDHRRKNRNEEAFQANVDRLKTYRSKLVIFPRKPTSQRIKKGDTPAEERKAVDQVLSKNVLAVKLPERSIKARAITKEERSRTVSAVLRKALTDGKLWGLREKRAKEKAEKAAAGGKKEAKGGEDDE